jgi:hypothetical protein
METIEVIVQRLQAREGRFSAIRAANSGRWKNMS